MNNDHALNKFENNVYKLKIKIRNNNRNIIF